MNALRHTTVQPIRCKDKIEEIKQLLKQQSLRDYFLFVMGINCGLKTWQEENIYILEKAKQTNTRNSD